MKKITYKQSGVNYEILDPVKKLAQASAALTSKNLSDYGFHELTDTRGESALVWKQNNVYMASVIEGLGTKNLVADDVEKITGKNYYENIAQDTVATIINDLSTMGAKPLSIHALWAVGDNDFYKNNARIKSLVKGWKEACNLAGATWGGGETPTLKGVIEKNAIVLGGSATGIIKSKKRIISDKKLKSGDIIILIKSNGINANGISLARTIAKKLPKGYATKLKNGKMFGEEILKKSNVYAKLIQNLLDKNIDIHYIANITGHGLRKLMRARFDFTYVINKIFEPQEIFLFIQKHAGLSDYEIYGTYNMGQDFAIFVPKKEVQKTLDIIKKNKFKGIEAGFLEKGKKQVIVNPKNIIYSGDRLDLR